MYKNKKGITLIALVITIIVMLILVGVTVSMAINGGLFEQAGKAASETNEALKTEGELASGRIQIGEEVYNSIEEYVNKYKGDNEEKISKETSYVGYYADVDGDKVADGVIYADLAFSKEGNEWGGFSYDAVTAEELKDYYVSGTYDGDFNEVGKPKKVLTATGEGKDRFYVMALEDVTTDAYTTFYWYYNAEGKMEDYETTTSTDFGTGKSNTAKIKGIWDTNSETPYGVQNAKDLWSQIDLINGWFVPSGDEWNAFRDALEVTVFSPAEGITEYSYGLNEIYWTSSQEHEYGASAFCSGGGFEGLNATESIWVRLSATY